MKLIFWGVRNSATTPDADKLYYGGNGLSMVVEARPDLKHLFLLDAGLGLARWGQTLPLGQEYQATLFLSSLSLDHILGFQFTPLAFSPHCQTKIIGPNAGYIALESVFDLTMAPIFSPVYGLENLLAKVTFSEATPGLRRVEGVYVSCYPFHGMDEEDVWGYRLSDGTVTLAYVSHARLHASHGGFDDYALELVRGASLLVVGAYDPDHDQSGGLSYVTGVALARAGGVPHLIFTAHHPQATDAHLRLWARKIQLEHPDLEIDLAYEGLQVTLTPPTGRV
jgi:ribonuclease BN (tRNA processing enzyme)